MEKRETQIKKNEIITDVICDSCGKSCKVDEVKMNGEQYYIFEFLKLEAKWGYNSKKDTERWSAQICEQCVDEKLSFIKFKIESYI